MPELIANGRRFFVLRLGAGEPTAVFVHGLVMDNLSSWWFTVANAAAREADVVCYDLRGHGRSERSTSGYSVTDSVDDLAAVLDALGISHPVHIVGNSYGGVVGLAFARAHPERTAGLVLVEAHAAIEGQEERDKDKLAHGLDLAGAVLDMDAVNSWLDQVGGRKLNRMAARAKELIYESTLVRDLRTSPPFTPAELAAIDCPVLILYGEHSDIVSRAVLLEQLLPHAELHLLKGIDHTALMSATAEVRRGIVDWLVAHRVAAHSLR
jgi:pimeloyl-ACP methyl ester carboxylesterase